MGTTRRNAVLGAGLVLGGAGVLGVRSALDDGDGGEPGRGPLAWAATDWPFPAYDPARTRNPPPESAPDGDLERAWAVRNSSFDDEQWAHPVVANGRAFVAGVASRGTTVRAIRAATGVPIWSHDGLGDGDGDPRLAAPGRGLFYRISDVRAPLGAFAAATGDLVWSVRDPPRGVRWTIGDGRLYLAGRADGDLHAYDAGSGEHLWSTVVADDRVGVRSYHPEAGLFAAGPGAVFALYPADGSVRWTHEVPRTTNSGPIVAGERAFVTRYLGEMALVALDPGTGAKLWEYPLPPSEGESPRDAARRWFEIGAATPDAVVVRERRADRSTGRLHAVEPDAGGRRWLVAPPDGSVGFGAPAVVGDSVYVSAPGPRRSTLLRLALDDGTRLSAWELPPNAGNTLVAEGLVIVEVGDGIVAFE